MGTSRQGSLQRVAIIQEALAITAVGLALASLASGQSGWVERTSAPTADGRSYHALAHDSLRGQTVRQSGGQTWEWDGTSWTAMALSAAPSARDLPAMTFDRQRQETVLFGGWSTIGGGLDDTWTFDGESWTQRHHTQRPPARSCAAMVHDSRRGRVVLFGGWSGDHYLNDTWEWDGDTWTQVTPARSPQGRAVHRMAYDPNRGRVVMFGGHQGEARLHDTWEYDGLNWRQVSTTHSPSARSGHAMAYDSNREAVMLFGGQEAQRYLADTWQWDGTAWTELRSPRTPAPRSDHQMVFQAEEGTLLMFGGNNETGHLADTWEASFARPAFMRFGVGCGGDHGTPELDVLDNHEPRVGQLFGIELTKLPPFETAFVHLGVSRSRWGEITLPRALHRIGMPGCTLYTSGEVIVPMLSFAGSVRRHVQIPGLATVLGNKLFMQGFAIDQAANVLGLIATAGAEACIGH